MAGQASAWTVGDLAEAVPSQARTLRSIKQGMKGLIIADFTTLGVTSVRKCQPGPDVWLVLRRNVHMEKIQYFLCNAPVETPLSTLIQIAGLRWLIETCFQEAKQDLGTGDYEVRTWTGWHHHVTLCIPAHHFLMRAKQEHEEKPTTYAATNGVARVGRPAEAAP